MDRNKNDQRVIGEPWGYLGINTFVYESTVDKAIEATERLEDQDFDEVKNGSSNSLQMSIGLSRESTLKSTTSNGT